MTEQAAKPPTIHAQAIAVERAYVNARGHRDTIEKLVAAGKLPAHELAALEVWLLDLGPAVATMKWLERNEAAVKAAGLGRAA